MKPAVSLLDKQPYPILTACKMHEIKIATEAAFDYFRKNSLTVSEIAILQPAEPFLDMAGEDLRRRIFMTTSDNGDSLCLRPEFTIPVCLQHIARGHTTPQYYAYGGEVFRQSCDAGSSFYQAGIEEFGAADEAEADARSLRHATAILHHIAPTRDIRMLIGDHAIFAAMLAALKLPDGWQKKMRRCFGNDRQLHTLLSELSRPAQSPNLPYTVSQLITHGNTQALAELIERQMLDNGICPSVGRTPQDIAARLIEKQAIADLHLDNTVLTALEDFLAIDVSLDKAEQTLNHFAIRHHLALEDVITLFSARIKAIDTQGLDLAELRYNAAFGRPLDYYTGFVYEIRDGGHKPQTLAGGGRYDRLLTMLGAPMPIPAVGFSIWLDQF
ncbi:MAG: ATP phosphoribosyltransferase regulatory subunit [Candidatus Tokpelaia sp. JSC189]|nr:MAG: ATP phosphoribosyltransferase regulatory subunit [Candidatus Tokpelaia sp. JSC189]